LFCPNFAAQNRCFTRYDDCLPLDFISPIITTNGSLDFAALIIAAQCGNADFHPITSAPHCSALILLRKIDAALLAPASAQPNVVIQTFILSPPRRIAPPLPAAPPYKFLFHRLHYTTI
jgi:hypothetical protein